MNDTAGPTELQRMTAAGWTPEQRHFVAQQCLLGQAQSIAAGKPGEARRLGAIIDMLSELDAVPAAAAAGPGTDGGDQA